MPKCTIRGVAASNDWLACQRRRGGSWHQVICVYVADARWETAIFGVVVEIAIANSDNGPGIGRPVATKVENVAGIDGTAIGPVLGRIASRNRVALSVR